MNVSGGEVPFETFPALDSIGKVRHAFTLRAPGVDVKAGREVALERLGSAHRSALNKLGLSARRLILGEQVHGREVAVVDAQTISPVPGVDGLITANSEVCLGIYVADCCAVYIADPERRVIALLHSGRKGSELGITTEAIARMRDDFGCEPANLVVQLSPCIRPPNYEIDFAAMIVRQCKEAGVQRISDCGICTAANPESYYSYRAERGQTGRMLALLALAD